MLSRWKIKAETFQLIVALTALLVGVLLYLTTRNHQQIFFINYFPDISILPQFPSTGITYSIPSFLHIYAFILLTTAFISVQLHSVRLICVFWLVIEILFEIGQHPLLAAPVAGIFPDWFNHYSSLQAVPNYFVNGRFDFLDITFLLLGALAAYLTVKKTNREGR